VPRERRASSRHAVAHAWYASPRPRGGFSAPSALRHFPVPIAPTRDRAERNTFARSERNKRREILVERN
jgi:hypothetical protein